jgi:hypothetical protein
MMPVARGERFECAMWRALTMWGCGVALVVTGAGSAAAQQPPPAGSGAGTLSAQAAVVLGVPAAEADALRPDTAADPGDKEKPPEEQAADTGGLVDFFKSTELTGFVDAYYGWNFNGEGPALLRNFDVNHNEFSFALAEVALEKKATADSRVGFRLDFDAGQTADMVNSFEPGGPEFLDNLQQGYVSFLAPVGKGLQIDFGKFVTPHGAEVIETRDNWNYSRGLLFALAIPYYHMGVRIGYPVTDTVSVTGFVVNGWNNVRENNNAKTLGGSVAIKPNDRLSIVQNYMVGAEQPDNSDDLRHLFDTVVSFALTDKVSLMGNYDYGRDEIVGESVDWSGVAGYLKYQHNENLAFIPRFEVIWDSKAFTTGAVQNVKEFTLTGEYKFSGLISRLEFRQDFSDEEFFPDGDGGFKKNQSTLTLGLVYAFTSAKP